MEEERRTDYCAMKAINNDKKNAAEKQMALDILGNLQEKSSLTVANIMKTA